MDEQKQRTEQENRARAGAARFLAEIIQQPNAQMPGADPAANLAWLIDQSGGNPQRLHKLMRVAWAERLATGKTHWAALRTASDLL